MNSSGAAPRPSRITSATLSRASGKNRASGIVAPGSSTRSPRSPIMPVQSHSAAQNASGSATDQRCSSGYSVNPWASRKRAIADNAARAGSGTQIGSLT
ncbi:MAG: hypothetical protein V9G12_00705 [Microthrixaceae bacterium]